MIERGYQDFADRWNPILDVFDEEGVRFAHEVHPSEIAYDYWTAKRTLEAIGHRESLRPELRPVATSCGRTWTRSGSCWDFARPDLPRRHARSRVRSGSTAATAGSAPTCPGPTRAAGWDFVTAGHGDVNWEPIFRTLNAIGYQGPTSVEWEDAGMDRLLGAPQALALVKELATITPPAAAFDAAFAAR